MTIIMYLFFYIDSNIYNSGKTDDSVNLMNYWSLVICE